MAPHTLAVLCSLLIVSLAGCSAPEETPYQGGNDVPPGGINGGGQQQQQYVPTRHDLASNSPQAIPAGDVFAHNFQITGSSIPVGYSLSRTDDSSMDILFIEHEDLAEFRAGQAVEGWAVQQNTAGTQQETQLPAGDYDLAIRCRNSFADCDIIYSLWATY